MLFLDVFIPSSFISLEQPAKKQQKTRNISRHYHSLFAGFSSIRVSNRASLCPCFRVIKRTKTNRSHKYRHVHLNAMWCDRTLNKVYLVAKTATRTPEFTGICSRATRTDRTGLNFGDFEIRVRFGLKDEYNMDRWCNEVIMLYPSQQKGIIVAEVFCAGIRGLWDVNINSYFSIEAAK